MKTSIAVLALLSFSTTGLSQDLYAPMRVSSSGFNDPMEFADLNGDGFVDIAADNAIALADGQGAFLPPQYIPNGPPYLTFHAGDLDVDGDVDLLVGGSGTLDYLSGDGTGQFGAPLPIFAIPSTRWSACGDLDNDGDVDVVANNLSVPSLRIALSSGGGAFALQADIALPFTCPSGVIAKLDGDSFGDLMIMKDSGAGLVTLHGLGNGQFSAPVAIASSNGNGIFELFDRDTDGDLDLAIGRASPPRVTVFDNDGLGHFTIARTIDLPFEVQAIRTGHLDQDGWPDIVVACQQDIHVAMSNGIGAFQAPIAYGLRDPRTSATVVDIDGDGLLDVLANSFRGGTFRLRGLGAGKLESYMKFSTQTIARGIAAADFDGDSHVDVAAIRYANVGMMLGDGSGSLATPTAIPVGFGFNTDGCAGDFDADGDQDLAITEGFSSQVSVMLNNGGGTFAPSTPYPAGPSVMVLTADQDGDDILDLALLSTTLARIELLLGNGDGTFTPSGFVGLGTPSYNQLGFTFRDVNTDGLADLIGVEFGNNGTPDTIRVFFSSGAGSFVLHQSFPAESAVTAHNSVLALGDVDGDADLDLAVGHGINIGMLRVYTNDGSGTFTLHTGPVPLPATVLSLAIANVDSSPIDDLVIGMNNFFFLVMPGSSAGLVEQQAYLGPEAPVRMRLTDMDGDGWLDMVCGANTFTPVPVVVSLNVSPLLAPPTLYCEAKTNSQGCTPTIFCTGIPSMSGPDDFFLTASHVLNNKPGTLLWSLSEGNIPFFGGTLCLQPPIFRTANQPSLGTPPPALDCTGNYAFHFRHSYMTSHALSPGTRVFAQYYSRDNGFAAPNNIGLTNALSFVINP